MKCFEGDDSDDIGGVNGVTRDTLIKFYSKELRQAQELKRLL